MRNVAVRCAAVRAPASIAAQAAADDRLVADRCPCAVFTATPTALGNSAAASATHRSSPDTNATGRAELGCDAAVERELAGFVAVDEHARERRAVDRVREHARCHRFRMPPDEEHGDAAILDARHHAELAWLALQQSRRRVDGFREEVTEIAVRIVDDHVGGTARPRARDGRARLCRHPAPRALVVGVARSRVVRMHDTGNALDVDGNEDPHGARRCEAGATPGIATTRSTRVALIAARSWGPARRAVRHPAG
jgi:hypothetical protein